MAVKTELIKTSLRGSVVESASNTYTEKSIDTNLSIRGDHVFVATRIFWKHDAGLSADTDVVDIVVAYASQTGIIGPDDPDFLDGIGFRMSFTTSGMAIMERTTVRPMEHFPIAVPQLFLGVKGTSLAAAVTASVKIEGYHVRVNTTEFFRLAQSR